MAGKRRAFCVLVVSILAVTLSGVALSATTPSAKTILARADKALAKENSITILKTDRVRAVIQVDRTRGSVYGFEGARLIFWQEKKKALLWTSVPTNCWIPTSPRNPALTFSDILNRAGNVSVVKNNDVFAISVTDKPQTAVFTVNAKTYLLKKIEVYDHSSPAALKPTLVGRLTFIYKGPIAPQKKPTKLCIKNKP